MIDVAFGCYEFLRFVVIAVAVQVTENNLYFTFFHTKIETE